MAAHGASMVTCRALNNLLNAFEFPAVRFQLFLLFLALNSLFYAYDFIHLFEIGPSGIKDVKKLPTLRDFV
jgi:hypothetical protein